MCWINGIGLLEAVQVQFSAECGRVRGDTSSPDVQKIFTTLEGLCLNVRRRDSLYEQAKDKVTAENVSKCFTIEADKATQVGLVGGAMTAQNSNAEALVHSLASSDSVELDRALSLSPVHDIYGVFQKLESAAVSCHVLEAVLHLRRARRAFLASNQSESAPERQFLIIEILESRT